MALFCTAIRRDSVSLSRFPFCSHVSCEISPIHSLKYPYTCVTSHFCFLIFFVVLFILILSVASVISLSLLFLMKSCRPHIDTSMLSLMLVRPLPPSFLDTHSLSISALGCKAWCIIINFLVLWSICLSSSLLHFKNGPKFLTRGTAQVFILLMRILLQSFVSRNLCRIAQRIRVKYIFVVFSDPFYSLLSLHWVVGLFIVCVPEVRTANIHRMPLMSSCWLSREHLLIRPVIWIPCWFRFVIFHYYLCFCHRCDLVFFRRIHFSESQKKS